MEEIWVYAQVFPLQYLRRDIADERTSAYPIRYISPSWSSTQVPVSRRVHIGPGNTRRAGLHEIKVEERLTRIEQLIETAMLMLMQPKKPAEPFVPPPVESVDTDSFSTGTCPV
jgi:hypothetical protein